MTELSPSPLDPEGLVWEHFGRLPIFRLSNGLREAMLQNMHPGLAAGVEHHSVFFEDPRARGAIPSAGGLQLSDLCPRRRPDFLWRRSDCAVS